MSLDGAYDDDNIFAKILRGEAPCHKVFEDEAALAFLDIFPQARGHTLVLPKARARNFLDLPATQIGAYMSRVQRIAAAVRNVLAPDGVAIIQYNGAPAGQTVFHLHFHVVPAYAGETMAGHGQAGRADDAALAALAETIASSL